MHYCVMYDISSNRLRRHVVKWCKQAGLRRMQKSVFAGPVPDDLLADLQQQVQSILAPDDRFCIIPLDKNALGGIALLGDANAQFVWKPKDFFRYF